MNQISIILILLSVLTISTSYLYTNKPLKPLNTKLFSINRETNQEIIKNIKSFLLSSLLFVYHPSDVFAKPEGVNRPDLLPKTQTSLIDIANFLSKGQEKKVISSIESLQSSTGYKLRVLCQSYPVTPGLAVKDYWNVDDNTIVLVVDKGEGFNRKGIPSNVINLNIGKNVDLVLPSQFWARLSNKLGNQYYVKEKGIDIAVVNTVEAISFCLQDKQCTDIPFEL